jgi:hypothetical protein
LMVLEVGDILIRDRAVFGELVGEEREHAIRRGQDEILNSRQVGLPLRSMLVRDFNCVFAYEIAEKITNCL